MTEHDIGKFIAKHRVSSGFKSQRQLAERTGISAATISRIESGIQRPSPETLKDLSKYLKTTSKVELMVVADYWDEDELLEPIDTNDSEEETQIKKAPSKEVDFVNKLELSDKKILEQFNLELDGKKLTEDESKGVIAYLRSLRQIGK